MTFVVRIHTIGVRAQVLTVKVSSLLNCLFACFVKPTQANIAAKKNIPTLDSCTILVKNGDVRSKRSKTRKSPPTKAMVRLTVSLPKAVLSRVNIIAGQMEVSAGWVIRKAVIEFVNRDIPLFRSDEKF
jgi:hypothetical protein